MLEATKVAASNIYHNITRRVCMKILNLLWRAEFKGFLPVKQESEDDLVMQGWRTWIQ